MSKKIQTFEETKRISTTKGFLGYRNSKFGILKQIVQNTNSYSTLKRIDSLVNILLAKKGKEVKSILK